MAVSPPSHCDIITIESTDNVAQPLFPSDHNASFADFQARALTE